MERPSVLAESFMAELLAEKRWPLKVKLPEIDCESLVALGRTNADGSG